MYRKSRRAIRLEAKRKRCAAMRAAKERKRLAESEGLRDVGGFVTDGNLGQHTVRLLAWPGDERAMAIRVDGRERRPRTCRGVWRCMAVMIAGKIRGSVT
jgi:hypothetical protein